MSVQHTEGPWITDPNHPCRVYCDDLLGSMVADCNGSHVFLITPETKLANAKLIAEAPAMEAALRRLIEVTEREDAHLSNFGEFAEARAILARIDS